MAAKRGTARAGSGSGAAADDPRFFASPAAFRRWLHAHHGKATELWVGFHKRSTGTPSLTWPESVDEALCVGWIDGVRKSLDAERYTIRFTPRKKTSKWSAVNVRNMERLLAAGRVLPAGKAAYASEGARKADYSYEQRHAATFDHEQEREFRRHAAAWADFQSRPPWYRRNLTYWVISAKRADTRERRLRTLIEASAAGRSLRELQPPATKAAKKVTKKAP